MDWTLFAIKPSSYISSLCYSIFRLEPYSSCSYNCIYCYARWYRWSRPRIRRVELVRLWRKLCRSLYRLDYPPPFYRLSTLSEPLQENIETKYVLSLELLRIAYKYEVPVVINTKSTLVTRSPWIDMVTAMADKGLVLVQISITVVDETLSSRLEPRAPCPWRRLEAVEFLREHSVPVVTRIQPIIPGIEDKQLESIEKAFNHGSMGVILESIRETRDGLVRLARAISYRGDYLRDYCWTPYQFTLLENREPLYNPCTVWKKEFYMKAYSIARAYNKPITLCKEGLYGLFEKSYRGDCCLTQFIKYPHIARYTLYELLYGVDKSYNIVFIDPEMYRLYPYMIRRPLVLHYNKLLRITRDQGKLQKLIH